MTIGIGILHRGGVLLCADSQYETIATKYDDSKVGFFECDFGKIGFTVAGNAHYAYAAIQSVFEAVSRLRNSLEFFKTIRSTLESEYTRLVLAHPNPEDVHYELILAIWQIRYGERPFTRMGNVWLEIANQTAVRFVAPYACIGVGNILAEYILQPLNSGQRQDEVQAKVIAAHVLKRVKMGAPGCGGHSQMLDIGLDGSMTWIDSGEIESIANTTVDLEDAFRSILPVVADPSQGEEMFELMLSSACEKAREARNQLTSISTFKRIEAQPTPQLSRRDPQSPQPLQE